MGKRPTSNPSDMELPPGWTALHASTAAGHRHLAVWRAFPDATQFEYDCAMTPPVDWLQAEQAVAWVGALREARHERLDLSEDQWRRLVGRIWPHLTERQRRDENEIVAELGLTPPRSARRGRPATDLANSAPGRRKPGPLPVVSRVQVEECRAALIAADKPHGYQAIARALTVSVATVRRRLRGN